MADRLEIAASNADGCGRIWIGNGLARDWGARVREAAPASSYLVVADERVTGLIPSLAAGAPGPVLAARAGEGDKNLARYAQLCEEALAHRPDRRTVVVAIGGGVVGDLAGFVAATLLRGLRCVQIPTTLLAQVDSAIGGKTGVNAGGGKNLVGAFHQPALTLIDPELLATLPKREWLTGYAEVLKYALLGRCGLPWDEADEAFFLDLENNPPTPVDAGSARWLEVVARCAQRKAEVVRIDEREKGLRALLNFGHTFGHVLEALAGYDGRVTHGEAVAMGMVLAAGFAAKRGACDPSLAERIRAHGRRVGLPMDWSELGRDPATGAPMDWSRRLAAPAAERTLTQDKKVDGGAVTLILPVAAGRCEVRKGFAAGEVADFIRGEEAKQSGKR